MKMRKEFVFNGFPFINKQGFPGIYNDCHAESQAMCFFVKKNCIFRDYERGQSDVGNGFLQLSMVQPRYQHAEIISDYPCLSCINLKDFIFEKLGINFTFTQFSVKK